MRIDSPLICTLVHRRRFCRARSKAPNGGARKRFRGVVRIETDDRIASYLPSIRAANMQWIDARMGYQPSFDDDSLSSKRDTNVCVTGGNDLPRFFINAMGRKHSP